MANSAALVKVGTTGSIYTAPAGTTLPTGSQATLNVAFSALGYISDAGVVESNGKTTNKVTAWQNGDVIREVQTEDSVTYKFAAMETSPIVLATYHGNYDDGVVEVNGLTLPRKPFVIDVLDGDDMVRIVVPYGQITERGDINWVNGDAAIYEMTVEAYPDPNYAGSLGASAKAYKYLYDVGLGVSA